MMNTEAFTGRAKAYTEARPGYPDAAVEHIRSIVPHDAVFADVGAGTGKFTEQIVRHGYMTFAIEPNADMREQLVITLAPFPNAAIINGTAEATTLRSNCVDVITSAQALRRFDIDKFRTECLRIGKPGCIVITIFNEGHKISTNYKSIGKISEGYDIATRALYKNPEIKKFPNPHYFTRDKWLLYYSSMEGVPLKGEAGYEAHTAELNGVFDRDSADGILCLNEVTYVFSEKIGF